VASWLRAAYCAGIISFASGAFAQTRSSFYDVTASNDITVSSFDGLTFTVLLGPNPWVVYNSTTYIVTDAFGFYVLEDTGDVSATGTNQNFWTFDLNNSGPGGLSGWEAANANSGITPGQSISFTFTTLNPTSWDRFGFHLRYSAEFEQTGGNTSFVAVPEPASLAALALGAAGIVRLRRRRRS
jgi:hypothetical protein